jgi:hypothetical protein
MKNKDYSKRYWKVYRWFKWEAKYTPYRFKNGVKNLWKWFPVIWKDRDYDHNFIFEILKFKLNNMANRFEQTNRFVDSEGQVFKLRTCVRLIQKLQDGYYTTEMHEYWENEMRMEPIEGSTNYSLEFDELRNDLDQYLIKYPNDIRRALKSTYLKDIKEPTNRQIAIVVSRFREDKAKKLLFQIMERNIFSWWD